MSYRRGRSSDAYYSSGRASSSDAYYSDIRGLYSDDYSSARRERSSDDYHSDRRGSGLFFDDDDYYSDRRGRSSDGYYSNSRTSSSDRHYSGIRELFSDSRAPSSDRHSAGAFLEPPPRSRRRKSDSSYYSCTNLEDDNDIRYIRASEARRQVEEAPLKRVRVPSQSSKKMKLAAYPDTFSNTEELDLQAKSPWKEYPVLSSGSWDPYKGKVANAARGVYNISDKSPFDIIYHDPAKGTNNSTNYSIAPYRPARSSDYYDESDWY